MSEVQTRPAAPRGRGSGRGGRGGFATRGGGRAGTRPSANGDSKHDTDSSLPTLEDEGDVGQLKQQYGSKVAVIKEMFPDWSSVDILFALQETDGDENLTVTRIAEGTISQWGEVSKPKKERTRPKAKIDAFTTTTGESIPAGALRNARGGRGAEGGRGRGRATERGGRGGARGKSTSQGTTNGTRPKDTDPLSVPTEEASEWNTKLADEAAAWGEPAATETTAATAAAAAPSTTTPAPAAKPASTWASMLRQSTAPKPAPKPKEPPVKAPEPVIEPLPAAEPTEPEPEPEPPAPVELPAAAEPETETKPAAPVEHVTPAVPVIPAVPAVPAVVVPEVALVPSKDQLTETNLDKIKDDSHPPVTETAASEAADSWDPRGTGPGSAGTPLSASQQRGAAAKPLARAAVHHPRRMLDQREAVRMPGNRDQVDRATVQFGAFSLNGPIDDDVDGDREEPETRPQPPEDSPVAHPRTSLPPAQPTPVPDAFPAQKPAAAQIPTGPAAAAPTAPAAGTPSASQATVQPPTAPQNNQQFGRFGQSAPQEPSSFPTTSKPFEPFSQQPAVASAAQSQFEGGFQGQGQIAQPPSQQQPGGPFSSAPSDFSSYYTADQQNRLNYYNQNFGQQQGAQGQQDALSSQQPQRSFSGYNGPQSDNLSQYPQGGAQQSRFGANATAESQATGTPTPSQATTSQAQAAPTTQAQSHTQQPHDYPYGNHPYYQNPYYSAYLNYNQGYNQGGYGGPYGKGGLNYQPSQYGITPQGPHGYSSPAGGFGQSALHRDSSGVGAAGLGDYGRAGSAQSGQQGLGGSGFGGVHDTFGRGGSSYQSQGAGQSFNAPGSQPGSGPSATDDLKPFGESKAGAGPSPSLGASARPGSAANNGPSQSGLPPPQSNPQSAGLGGIGGYGGYPSHVQQQQQQQQQAHSLHGNQSGGAGGYGMSASGGQSHQNSYGAGGYGTQGFAGGAYYGNAPRGWGNNYHLG
ncbi:uncharacterized protein C8A04DRAFT_26218 [Dichotomopilus funicola]|uniref:RNA polymerase II degradation factor 1 n=1 Tax=Dichotomopilus funicola TaxID=1934379 RepID=A0AAN6V9I4_9PEZI|nr:hypothetical protein C8A04DRAFT_26218 [Dichotomopilus funicola]